MTSETATARPEARRLHAAAIGAEALDALRSLALPLIVVVLVGGGGLDRILSYGALGLVVSVGLAWVQWTSTRWYLHPDHVRLRRGILSEKVIAIPFDRVQAIDTVRGPVQRLFGVVELHVQAAGGGRRGEIVLKAVDLPAAEELREAVRKGSDPLREESDAVQACKGSDPLRKGSDPLQWALGRRDLLVAALTSGSLGVLVPVVAGASQAFDDVLGAEDAERLVPTSVHGALLLALAVVLLAWLLSVLGTIVAFAGFRVVREPERLRISRGFLERREASVPVGRVHAVRIVESPLREPFGLAQVRVETAGYAGEPATAQTLIPLVRRREVAAVLAELVPELRVELDGLEPLPRRAARRYVVPPRGVAILVSAPLAIVFGAPALPALVLVPLAVALGLARHRAGGWRLSGDRIVLRTRGLTRTTAAADAHRLQTVSTATTPFQRRAQLATIAVAVSSGRRFALRHVEERTADDLLGRLGKIATSPPASA
jgi:putative membrane protein